MPQRIVIVGGGVGGSIVANIVSRALSAEQAEITVIDATGQHVYMPGWLNLPFNGHERLELSRSERSLLNQHVELVTGSVTAINTKNRELTVQRAANTDRGDGQNKGTEARYPYDYLVP